MPEYWISFASEDSHLGVVILQAASAEEALDGATRLNLNPGGEAMIVELPPGEESELPRNELISLESLPDLGYKKTSELTEEEANFIDSHPAITRICDDCNED